jgi:hypothetical protein
MVDADGPSTYVQELEAAIQDVLGEMYNLGLRAFYPFS